MKLPENYRLGSNLNVMKQLELARRLSGPLPTVDIMLREENKDKDSMVLVVLILGSLSEENYLAVVNICLQCILRKDSQNNWVPLVNKSGNIMFDDVTLKDLTNIIAFVINENLSDFINTALSSINL